MSDIEAPDVPGEEHEHEACPSRDEKRASDAARQRVESQTAEIGHVVCGDLARDERDEVHRVIDEQPLEVERVALRRAEWRAGQCVFRLAEEVVAALLSEAPQPAHSAAHVASGIADHMRAEVRGKWPRDENCDYA